MEAIWLYHKKTKLGELGAVAFINNTIVRNNGFTTTYAVSAYH
jgi:hypothetical protein